ncbi:MAG: uracil-DNA glycosylase [Firmicutes bacterium]|nr:uracil-DNA glycosylase [Bacillota bacterium]MCL5040411.1 uracil-DNA glycosylase [Bacillota bacterium]
MQGENPVSREWERRWAELKEEISHCLRCPLSQTRTNAVPGEGSRGAVVFFVGEAPGEKEDLAGRPFVGPAGRYFDRLLPLAGLIREEVFVTGLVKCRPPQNRNPRAAEIRACSEYLCRQLELIAPRLVVPLGNFALKEFVGKKFSITQVHGQPLDKDGLRYFPLFHPAALFYNEKLRQEMEKDMESLRRYLRSFLSEQPGGKRTHTRPRSLKGDTR